MPSRRAKVQSRASHLMSFKQLSSCLLGARSQAQMACLLSFTPNSGRCSAQSCWQPCKKPSRLSIAVDIARRRVRQLRSSSSHGQHSGRQPLHANHISNGNYGSPQTVRQAAQTSRRVLESALCSPWGGSMSHPGTPSLQPLGGLNEPPWTPLSTASVSQFQWAPGEAKAGGIVCSPASRAMASHCSATDTPCYLGRGCTLV